MPFDFSLIKTPIPYASVNRVLDSAQIPSLAHASIRRLAGLIGQIENDSGEKFIRMELGVPGIDTPQIGIDAEIAALKSGVTSIYPPLDGIPVLKKKSRAFANCF